MKLNTDGFLGQVKRALSERKFNTKDEQCCRTGGRGIGCPFFRLSKALRWVCTLYRSAPTFTERTKRYERLSDCMKNKKPPKKKKYSIHCDKGEVCDVIAVSKEEAVEIYRNNHSGIIIKIIEGTVIKYENLI